MKYFALLGALLLTVVACSGKSDHGGFIDDTAGGKTGIAGHSGSSAGTGGKGDTTGDSGAGGESGGNQNSLAPVVTITSPEATKDPTSDKVLVDPNITVVCVASASPDAGAALVNAATVQISALDATGKQIATAAGKATGKPDEYSANFVLGDIAVAPNGVVSFSCTAADKATPSNKTTATISTLIDHGPTITVSGPLKDSAHSLNQALEFDFVVAPAPIAQGDTGAAIGDVQLAVDGVDIAELPKNEVSPGKYHLSLDLTASRFKPTPTGPISVSITAKNSRTPPATSSYSYHVLIDGTGPIVTITAPKTTFIGGKVTLQFTVTDDSAGVDPTKVSVTLTDELPDFYPGDKWSPAANGAFSYTFDTKLLHAQTEVTVNISAADLVGNVSVQGASIFYRIDNVRPDLDLQPPDMIERKTSSGTDYCSDTFDPLGVSPNDLDVIPGTNLFRALLWDQGNHGDGQKYDYFSGIDDKTVNLYVQSNPSAGLLRNVEGAANAECDGVVPASPTLKFVTLVPIAPAGTALYSSSAASVPGCSKGSDNAATKMRLCNGGSDLYRVIQHELATTTPAVPAIYSAQPTPDNAQCSGSEFNLADLVSADGWLCIAVVAKDLTGNPAVSAPLRLCLDSDKYPGEPTCKTNLPAVPPSCIADTCIPQGHFRGTQTPPVIIDLP